MDTRDRTIIEDSRFIEVKFPGGSFFATEASFYPTGINFKFRGELVGHIKLEFVEDVIPVSSSRVTIIVDK